MSTNSTCSPDEIARALDAHAAYLTPAYASLMLVTVLSTLLLPLFVALFYFSNAAQRTSAMFICVVLSVGATIAGNGTQIALVFKGLYHSFEFSPMDAATLLVFTGLLSWLPNFMADLALLFRMLVVYPPSTTHRVKFVLILMPAVLLKLIRAASFLVFITNVTKARHGSAATSAILTPEAEAGVIIERVCAALDNGYATIFFLWKLRSTFLLQQSSSWVEGGQPQDSFLQRVRTLCWLAATSFLIPFPLCIAQLVLVVTAPNTMGFNITQNLLSFTSATCVAFATVWGSNNSPRRSPNSSTEPSSSSRIMTASALSARRESHRPDPEAGSIRLKSLDQGVHIRVEFCEHED